MNAYTNSLIFFTKVSVSCLLVQLFFDYHLNIKTQLPQISYPFLHWLSNFIFYYLCGYLSVKIKDSLYFKSYRIKQNFNIKYQKKIYWIHKKHHEFIDVNGYVAEYKSLIESILITTSDILPFIIFGCDIHQFLAWIIIGVIYNVEGHSSINLFFITDNFHNKHHTHFNVNYGIGQYLDRIFDTDGIK